MVDVLHITEEDVLPLLLKEYPELHDAHPKVIRRFVDTEGRASNTFLLSSNKSGFGRFVAKGMILHKDRGLELEWYALTLAKEHLLTPILLVPDHIPVTFLLLSYIDGISADEALQEGRSEEEIFRAIGEETGKLHTISVPRFGNLLADDRLSWKDYLMQKIPERINGMKGVASDSIIAGAFTLFDSLSDTVEQENKNQSILIHQDIYLNNFLFEEGKDGATLIDYGMARGGRPLYDLAKFFILDIYHKPERRDMFLKGYMKSQSIPNNFEESMKLYLLKEAAGMVNFFHSIGHKPARAHAIQILRELIRDSGQIIEIIRL